MCLRSTRARPATVPFVAKTIGRPIAKIAARIMAGESLDQAWSHYGDRAGSEEPRPHRGQGSRFFPFAGFPRRRHAARGPEMKSTGGGDGAGPRFRHGLFAKAQPRRPASTCRVRAPSSCRCATKTRRACCRPSGCWPISASACSPRSGDRPSGFSPKTASPPKKVNKVLEGRPHIEDRHPATARSSSSSNSPPTARRRSPDSKSLRRAALMQKVPYYTTLSGMKAVAQAIAATQGRQPRSPPAAELFRVGAPSKLPNLPP